MGKGLRRRDNGGNLTNVQCKSNLNSHYKSPLYNKNSNTNCVCVYIYIYIYIYIYAVSIVHIVLVLQACKMQELWGQEGFSPDFKGKPGRPGNVQQSQNP
jgi:hypothetical protein